MTTTAALLTVLGFLIVAIGAWCGFWVWLDAREAAEQRRHEAEMADAAVARAKHARIPARDDRPNRYLSDDERRPE